MKSLLADPDLAPVLAALPRARVVGGAVRDTLAGRAVADIDLAAPEPPEIVAAALEEAGVRTLPTGLSHGTVTAISNHRPFEITTLRRDVATDGRHAEVAWTEDWREDAARRDFTINAMSLDQSGQLHDYFGGTDDLAAGRVRFVGPAAPRIAEDYLRILRFFRFYARYGAGPPDGEAAGAIAQGLPGLALLSAERVWSELKKILAADDPVAAMRLMDSLGVLGAILPEGADAEKLAKLCAAGAPAQPILRFAALVTGDVAAIAARLKLSTAEAETVAAWRHGPVPLPGNDAELRRMLADEPAEILIGRLWLASGFGPKWDALRARLADLPRPVFPLEGRDALALGAKPGPAVGVALRAVRQAWLEQGCEMPPKLLTAQLKAALREAQR
jgi:poly(A) polymerase/tRNA nucleotidyltransferase (CCA-adding enzyme)